MGEWGAAQNVQQPSIVQHQLEYPQPCARNVSDNGRGNGQFPEQEFGERDNLGDKAVSGAGGRISRALFFPFLQPVCWNMNAGRHIGSGREMGTGQEPQGSDAGAMRRAGSAGGGAHETAGQRFGRIPVQAAKR